LGLGNLVGRVDAVDAFVSLQRAVVDGQRKILLVEADPGLGKTALLSHLIEMASSPGSAAEGLAWTQVHAVHDRLASGRPLSGFAPHIPGACWESAAVAPSMFTFVNETHYDVIQRYCAFLEKELTEHPLLIVVDDLQFADQTTLRLLANAIRQLDGLPALFVIASRVTPRSDEVRDLLADLPPDDSVRIRLNALTAAETAEVAERTLHRSPTPDELRVLKRAGGSPLFTAALLERIVQRSAEGGDAPTDSVSSSELEPEFREFVLESLMPLRGQTRKFLEVASLTERGFTLSELSLLTSADTVTLWDHLRDAVGCGLLVESESGLDFRHDLVKSAIYESMPASVRRGLHRHVAETYARDSTNPVVVANHFMLAGADAGAQALPWLRLAAHRLSGHNSRSALELLDQAVVLCSPQHPERPLLDAERAYALCWDHRFQDAVDLVDVSLQLTTDSTARTQLYLSKMKALLALGQAVRSAETLARMLDECTDPTYADEVEALRALAYLIAGENDAAALHSTPLLTKDRTSPLALALAHSVHAQLLASNLHVYEGGAAMEIAFEHIQRDQTGEALGYVPQIFQHNMASNVDDLEAMVAATRSGRDIAEAKGLSWALPGYHGFDAIRLFDLGRFDDALTEAETGLQIAVETGSNLGALLCISAIAHVRIRTGDVAAAKSILARSNDFGGLAGLPLGLDEFVLAEALVAIESGDAPGAILILRLLWDEIAAGRLELFSRRILIPYVHVLRESDDTDGLRSVCDVVGRWSDRSASNVPSIRALWLQSNALATESVDDIAASIALWRTSWRTLSLADALVDGAAIAGRRGLKQLAREYLAEARSIFESVGAHGSLAKANRIGLGVGVAVKRGRTAVRPVSGWSSLSPAELEVARLVADGFTNRQVADQLFVSPRTIETHLNHVFTKLAIRSRRELGEQVRTQLTPES
jgi:DNA-binding CsgD family transcriptional regulator/tetratricopeptide (TPR) repeat protein